MANQLICDLCGGKIVMRAGGVGVCENCSMEYSLESLREKMGQPQQSAPQAPAVKAEDDRIKNKLLQAKRALVAKHYWDAAKYCEEIHDIDCTHQEAWFIRVQAEVLRDPKWGASKLTNARPYIEDEKLWQQILTNLRPALKDTEFDEYSAECAIKLLAVDGTFGQEYVQILLENTAKKIKEQADWQRNRFAEHQRKRPPFTPSDNADIVSIERNFGRCLLTFQNTVKALGQLLAACEQRGLKLDEAFEKPFGQMQAFFDDAEKFRQWKSHMEISSGVRHELSFHDRLEPFITEESKEYHALKREYERAIAPIAKKLQQAKQNAIDQYWVDNRAKKEKLEQERADLQKQIQQLQQKEKEINSDKTGQTLNKRIGELQRELASLGVFKGKQKRAIQDQIAQLRSQISRWEKDHAVAKDANRRQISVLRDRIARVNRNLQNPEI